MSGNKSIRDFLRLSQPPQPASAPQSQNSSSEFRVPSLPPALESQNPPLSKFQMGQSTSAVSRAPEPQGYTSSLSPQPSSESESPEPEKETTPLPQAPSSGLSGHVVKSSDDEDEDSDSSLEDLITIFATKSSESRPKPAATNGFTPKTPTVSSKTSINFHTSPLTVQTKYKFDMKTLISHSRKDDATEASSKRVKAMMAPKDDVEHDYLVPEENAKQVKFPHGALLESVVDGKDEGGMTKVTRALMRTEATVTKKSWYFFDTQAPNPKPGRKPFPEAIVSKEWQRELKDPQLRQHSFLSGFVEDMVGFGKKLPDELFLWILDEAFLEPNEPLRTSYLNTLRTSSEQLHRLVVPDALQSLFQRLGATSTAASITQKIKPTLGLSAPYPHRNWSILQSVLKFLGQIARSLQQQARTHVICTFLRMAVDRVVLDNVDLLVVFQGALGRLSRYAPDNEWESCCEEVCKTLFESVQLPTFRLQIVDSISSAVPRTHDLRRRLAMCFYFNDISYSLNHPHEIMDLDRFITRLDHTDFDTNSQTDYPQLTALVLLLNIAVDDGRSTNLGLSDKETGRTFNKDVDDLVAAIKDIMTSIGNPGAAFISRIEAKEALELISQRIADTIRTEMKPREAWFDRNRGRVEEDLEAEKKGMNRFLAKMSDVGRGVNGKTGAA